MENESYLPISHQEWHNNANRFSPTITSRSFCENVRTLNCQLSGFLGSLMSDFLISDACWWLDGGKKGKL